MSSIVVVDEGIQEAIRYNELLTRVELAVEALSDLDKRILMMYLNLGSYRAVGKEIGIPWESSYSWIKAVIDQVRQSVFGDIATRKKYSTSKGQRKLQEYVQRA